MADNVTPATCARAEEPTTTASPHQIYERYVWATAMTHNAEALAEMFTTDGVIEAPLAPSGEAFPRRLRGRDEIRKGLAAYYERSTTAKRSVDVDQTRYVLHRTSDPDVFILEIDAVEIDAAFDGPSDPATMSLVQIFRARDGKISLIRDYFAPDQAG